MTTFSLTLREDHEAALRDRIFALSSTARAVDSMSVAGGVIPLTKSMTCAASF